MNNSKPFTDEELEISEEVMRLCLRSAANEYGFLKNPIFTLKPVPTDETETIGADYSRLWYNPKWVIEKFHRNKEKMVNAIVHCVLHCLYLHPSMLSVEDDIFDAAADTAILIMMYNAGAVKLNIGDSFIDEVVNKCGSTSTSDIFRCASSDAEFLNKICSLTDKHKLDDHALWHKKDDEKNKDENRDSGNDSVTDEGSREEMSAMQAQVRAAEADSEETGKAEAAASGKSEAAASGKTGSGMGEEEWSAMLVTAKSAAQSGSYGLQHGDFFMEIKKPDRFSRFSYREYIRRFAMAEVVTEDPETIDMMMYTAGFDLYDDITLVEFSEVREQATPSDIIIAIDISGSCEGDIAVNFLRQVYSIFEEMDIKSSVNIHAVTFDTQIISKAVIRNKKDARELIENYNDHTMHGWGGTDFQCVFEYADNFRKNNRGKKLNGLFFFSDGYGAFPPEKRKYRTTFFIPYGRSGFSDDLSFIPDWVECVKYDDENN